LLDRHTWYEQKNNIRTYKFYTVADAMKTYVSRESYEIKFGGITKNATISVGCYHTKMNYSTQTGGSAMDGVSARQTNGSADWLVPSQ